MRRSQNLPEIKEGDPCTPGQLYQMECNRCHCTEAKTLLCTKIACANWSDYAALKEKLKQETKKSKIRSKPSLRTQQSILPQLPKEGCKPGRTYRKGCRRCFCNDVGVASCSLDENGACKLVMDGQPAPVRSPEDIRLPFKREELKKIQTLPNASQKCEAGKIYKVSCNNCVCTENNNLICTKSLCLSFDDINRVEADERSGKKCTTIKEPTQGCIECKCTFGKTACKRIPDCVVETRTRLSKGNSDLLKMQIDPVKDTCIPGGIYTDNCNRCYCQPDSSLRCTQKTCLNYAQSKALDDQFKRLEREGL